MSLEKFSPSSLFFVVIGNIWWIWQAVKCLFIQWMNFQIDWERAMFKLPLILIIGINTTKDRNIPTKEFGTFKEVQHYYQKKVYKQILPFLNSSGVKGEKCTLEKVRQKPPPPFGLKIYKGYKNVLIRRDFADFIINHPVAQSFSNYLRDTVIPDEHLYATLGRITHVTNSTNGGL